jgi:hypothetical protein
MPPMPSMPMTSDEIEDLFSDLYRINNNCFYDLQTARDNEYICNRRLMWVPESDPDAIAGRAGAAAHVAAMTLAYRESSVAIKAAILRVRLRQQSTQQE